jgi:hypothetical protein
VLHVVCCVCVCCVCAVSAMMLCVMYVVCCVVLCCVCCCGVVVGSPVDAAEFVQEEDISDAHFAKLHLVHEIKEQVSSPSSSLFRSLPPPTILLLLLLLVFLFLLFLLLLFVSDAHLAKFHLVHAMREQVSSLLFPLRPPPVPLLRCCCCCCCCCYCCCVVALVVFCWSWNLLVS